MKDIIDSIAFGIISIDFINYIADKYKFADEDAGQLKLMRLSYYYLINNLIVQFGIERTQIITAISVYNGNDSADARCIYESYLRWSKTIKRVDEVGYC